MKSYSKIGIAFVVGLVMGVSAMLWYNYSQKNNQKVVPASNTESDPELVDSQSASTGNGDSAIGERAENVNANTNTDSAGAPAGNVNPAVVADASTAVVNDAGDSKPIIGDSGKSTM